MLLSNQRVAATIAKKFPECALLRNHGPPLARGLTKVTDFLNKNKLGTLDLTSSKTFNDSLMALKDKFPPHVFMTIQFTVTKAMQLATYVSSGDTPEWLHYALAIPVYTHFTSPIRRYADCIAHRQLAAAIGWADYKFEGARITRIAGECNERKLAARKAQDQSSVVFLCVYLKTRQLQTDAVVLSLGERFVHCFLPDLGFDHKVYFVDSDIVSATYDKNAEVCMIRYHSALTPAGPARTTKQTPSTTRLRGRSKSN